MTIKELIEDLQQLDPNLEVLMAKDEEGNSITNYSGWCTGYWNDEDQEFETEEEWVLGRDEEELEEEPFIENGVVLFPY